MSKRFTSPQEVAKHLESIYPNHNFAWKKSGQGLVGFCPKHEDKKTPNLKILKDKDGKGWHWYCFAQTCGFFGPKEHSTVENDISIFNECLRHNFNIFGSNVQAYLSERIPELGVEVGIEEIVSIRDFGAYTPNNFDFSSLEHGEIREKLEKWHMNEYDWLVFTYRDIIGKPIYLKFRNVSVPKYDPKYSDTGMRIIKLADKDTPAFFNIDAVRTDLPFLIVNEGEFDTITTLITLKNKYPAVCLGGIGRFTTDAIVQLSKTAKDKAIFIAADWDEAGQSRVEKLVEEFSYDFLKKRKIFALPTAPEDSIKDFDETLKGHYGDEAEEIIGKIFENAVSLAELKEKKIEEAKRKEREILNCYPDSLRKILGSDPEKPKRLRFSIGQILSTDFPETVSTFDIFYEGVNLLVSRGGIGKSFAMLIAAIDYAFRSKNRVLYISFEDLLNKKFKEERVKKAIEYYAESIRVNKAKIEQTVNDYVDIDFSYESVFDKDRRGKLIKTEYFDIFERDLKEYDFIIIDPFLSFIGIDELDSSLIRKALLKVRQLLINEEKQKIIVFTHHTNKNLKVFSELSNKSKLTFEDYNDLIEMVRGTMETTNVIRNVVFAVGHPVAKNIRRLVIVKSNVAPTGKIKEVITPWVLAKEYESLGNNNKTGKMK